MLFQINIKSSEIRLPLQAQWHSLQHALEGKEL